MSHGNLTIRIQTDFNVSQPGSPLIGNAAGETVVTPDVSADVDEEPGRVIQVDRSITLGDLVRALNSVGVTPRDLVAVLTAAKAAGALQADLQMI